MPPVALKCWILRKRSRRLGAKARPRDRFGPNGSGAVDWPAM